MAQNVKLKRGIHKIKIRNGESTQANSEILKPETLITGQQDY
jgi:hypothetical protein